MTMTESALDRAASYRQVVPAGDGWFHRIEAGQTLRILGCEGNQAADTIFYDAEDPAIAIRRRIPSPIRGRSISPPKSAHLRRRVADHRRRYLRRHDTLGGACASESNQVRYALGKKHMHSCRNTYLKQLLTSPLSQNAPGGPMGSATSRTTSASS